MNRGPAGDEGRRRLVRDEATGGVSELMYVGDFEDPWGHLRRRQREYPRGRQRLAFLRPEGGGREWITDPDHVTALGTGLPAGREEAS